MRKTKKTGNRDFGDNPPKDEIPSDAVLRKRANIEIRSLLKQHKGKRIIDLLEAIARRYPRYIVKVAVERIEKERKRNGLSFKEIVDFEQFKQKFEQNGVS